MSVQASSERVNMTQAEVDQRWDHCEREKRKWIEEKCHMMDEEARGYVYELATFNNLVTDQYQIEMYKDALYIIDRASRRAVTQALFSWVKPLTRRGTNPMKLPQQEIEDLLLYWVKIANQATVLRCQLPEWAVSFRFHPTVVSEYESLHRGMIDTDPNMPESVKRLFPLNPEETVLNMP